MTRPFEPPPPPAPDAKDVSRAEEEAEGGSAGRGEPLTVLLSAELAAADADGAREIRSLVEGRERRAADEEEAASPQTGTEGAGETEVEPGVPDSPEESKGEGEIAAMEGGRGGSGTVPARIRKERVYQRAEAANTKGEGKGRDKSRNWNNNHSESGRLPL